jgi:hypothetical protein
MIVPSTSIFQLRRKKSNLVIKVKEKITNHNKIYHSSEKEQRASINNQIKLSEREFSLEHGLWE